MKGVSDERQRVDSITFGRVSINGAFLYNRQNIPIISSTKKKAASIANSIMILCSFDRPILPNFFRFFLSLNALMSVTISAYFTLCTHIIDSTATVLEIYKALGAGTGAYSNTCDA